MTNSFKALSALLSYPTEDTKAAAEEIRTVIHKEVQGPIWALHKLDKLIDEIKTLDLFELQERYVFLFDRTRSLSLHLFEHVHGESRDRGQAMVDLQELYAQSGLEIGTKELPDYFPLFLEYLSLQPKDEARALLAEPVAVIVALKERLKKRKSIYTSIFAILETMAAAAPAISDLEELRRAPDDDPNDLEALDKAWKDAPVTFGPGEEGCPQAEQMLKRMEADDTGLNVPERRAS